MAGLARGRFDAVFLSLVLLACWARPTSANGCSFKSCGQINYNNRASGAACTRVTGLNINTEFE